jgi:hypothetical protein
MIGLCLSWLPSYGARALDRALDLAALKGLAVYRGIEKLDDLWHITERVKNSRDAEKPMVEPLAAMGRAGDHG